MYVQQLHNFLSPSAFFPLDVGLILLGWVRPGLLRKPTQLSNRYQTFHPLFFFFFLFSFSFSLFLLSPLHHHVCLTPVTTIFNFHLRPFGKDGIGVSRTIKRTADMQSLGMLG
ncbi:hypothetical protein QBC38DRAFT_122477 [Podospora fimiseda]|uniref:Uncharacterized protein n=1 Tax=Podospora fimiseda TaxID=252190 RepID=A0AAN7BU86_9PEZI|nr:hypothetical protein QBC38DRAFT_122477 [Podospora fimiseda]